MNFKNHRGLLENGTIFLVIGGFLYASTSSLKRILKKLVSDFQEARRNFIFSFLQKPAQKKN
jgi:hypothetical protein